MLLAICALTIRSKMYFLLRFISIVLYMYLCTVVERSMIPQISFHTFGYFIVVLLDCVHGTHCCVQNVFSEAKFMSSSSLLMAFYSIITYFMSKKKVQRNIRACNERDKKIERDKERERKSIQIRTETFCFVITLCNCFFHSFLSN